MMSENLKKLLAGKPQVQAVLFLQEKFPQHLNEYLNSVGSPTPPTSVFAMAGSDMGHNPANENDFYNEVNRCRAQAGLQPLTPGPQPQPTGIPGGMIDSQASLMAEAKRTREMLGLSA